MSERLRFLNMDVQWSVHRNGSECRRHNTRKRYDEKQVLLAHATYHADSGGNARRRTPCVTSTATQRSAQYCDEREMTNTMRWIRNLHWAVTLSVHKWWISSENRSLVSQLIIVASNLVQSILTLLHSGHFCNAIKNRLVVMVLPINGSVHLPTGVLTLKLPFTLFHFSCKLFPQSGILCLGRSSLRSSQTYIWCLQSPLK